MTEDLTTIIKWLDQQGADKVSRIARWCEHNYGELHITQEAGSIIELNGFRYRKPEQDKLID